MSLVVVSCRLKVFGCNSLFVDGQSDAASVQKREKEKIGEPGIA